MKTFFDISKTEFCRYFKVKPRDINNMEQLSRYGVQYFDSMLLNLQDNLQSMEFFFQNLKVLFAGLTKPSTTVLPVIVNRDLTKALHRTKIDIILDDFIKELPDGYCHSHIFHDCANDYIYFINYPTQLYRDDGTEERTSGLVAFGIDCTEIHRYAFLPAVQVNYFFENNGNLSHITSFRCIRDQRSWHRDADGGIYKREPNCSKYHFEDVLPKIIYYLRKNGNPDLRRYSPPSITTKKEKKAKRQLGCQSEFPALNVGFGYGKDPLYLKDEWSYFRNQACGREFSERKLIFVTAHRKAGR